MDAVQLKLAFIWVAVMLTYLLGDVLRMYSGDVKPGEMGEMKLGQAGWLGIAVLMVIPIAMVVFTVLVEAQGVNRWANIVLAGFWFLFNLVGLPTYPGHYDKFLLAVSMVFNLITIWLAWGWR